MDLNVSFKKSKGLIGSGLFPGSYNKKDVPEVHGYYQGFAKTKSIYTQFSGPVAAVVADDWCILLDAASESESE